MTRRLTQLTDAHRAAIPGHVARWIAIGQATGEADWPAFADGARRCYEYAGLPWHGNVVQVSSPLVLALAAPIAGRLLDRGAVRGAVHRAVDRAVDEAVGGAVRGAVDRAVHRAVDRDVGGAVRGAVHRAVDRAVDEAVGRDVRGAVHRAVDRAVDEAVYGAVDRAVDRAVYGAVDGAVRGDVRDGWYRYCGGQWWAGWQAYTSFFRDVCDLQLDGDLWDRDRAYAQAQSAAGWWWPHRQFVMVADRPRRLRLEQTGPAGFGSHRLHCEDGPAIAWSDGWALHFWHGIQVPADLVEGDGWAPDRILREPNSEIRRCAIERRGWHRFVVDAGLAQVGPSVPDPGNPGRVLALYDVPAAIYDEPIRVLICENGSRDRDGRLRTFGLTVPADTADPLTAAAWTYGVGASEYAALARRT